MKISIKSDTLEDLQTRLEIKFKQIELLKNAFIHRSYLNEHKNFKGQSNERLEFLGDSVLSLVVSKHLYLSLPKSTEGELTKLRAALVRTETLANVAAQLSLGKYLYLSRGEEESNGRASRAILADTFEALVGAIYLDQGLPLAQKFIETTILASWQKLAKESVADNKSKLQEVLQRKYHKSPTYKVLNSWGPDHDRRFEIGVFLEEHQLGRGIGRNKQAATQNAAGDALARFKK